MMSCQDCERYLIAFLDRALDVKTTLEVEDHLRACASCSGRAEAEQTFHAFVRQQTVAPPLSAEVKRRIIHRAMQDATPAPTRRHSGLAMHIRDFALGVAAAAAVLFLLFGPLSQFLSADDLTQQFAREASMVYQTYQTDPMPAEVVSADDTIITKWFNSRMGYALKIPCITDQSTKLLGGRLCRLFDRKTAAMMYRRNGKNIILFAFKGGRMTLPDKYRVRTREREYYVQRISGRPVAIWQHDGITYSIVGDLPQDDLLQVASTIYYR